MAEITVSHGGDNSESEQRQQGVIVETTGSQRRDNKESRQR